MGFVNSNPGLIVPSHSGWNGVLMVNRKLSGSGRKRSATSATTRWSESEGGGALSRVLTKQEVAEWTAFKASIGDVDWRDVVAGWRAHNVQTTGFAAGSTLTVQEACKSYLEEQQKRHEAKKLALGTLRQKRRKIGWPSRRLSVPT